MNLCSYGHDEVCYEGNNCPVCDVADVVKSLEKELNSYVELLDNKNLIISGLEEEVNTLELKLCGEVDEKKDDDIPF